MSDNNISSESFNIIVGVGVGVSLIIIAIVIIISLYFTGKLTTINNNAQSTAASISASSTTDIAGSVAATTGESIAKSIAASTESIKDIHNFIDIL